MTEDETVGQHHQLNGHEFEQTQRGGEGQGSLACCSPWGHKESDMTEKLISNIIESFPMCKTLRNLKYCLKCLEEK